MQSTSRDSLAALRGELEVTINGAGDLPALAGDLFAVADLLAGQARLRRMLSDPSIEPARRSDTAGNLLRGKIGDASLGVVSSAVTARWSASWDLADALGELGNEALFGAAEKSGALNDVEDELFRFGRILDAEPQLTTLLDDQSVPTERRSALLGTVTEGKVNPITTQLLRYALSQAGRSGFPMRVEALAEGAASRQHRSIARVRSAVALSPEQEERLAASLSSTYGRSIGVRTQIDPSVIGGLIIRVGDDLIDGSVASRLAAARSALSAR
jgi:F-type H+-transporting ATPase subunit delta